MCYSNRQLGPVPIAPKPFRVSVELLKDGKALWKAVTDNHGLANLWLAVEDVQSTVKASECIVSIDGVSQTAAPEKWDWTSEAPVVNTYTP